MFFFPLTLYSYNPLNNLSRLTNQKPLNCLSNKHQIMFIILGIVENKGNKHDRMLKCRYDGEVLFKLAPNTIIWSEVLVKFSFPDLIRVKRTKVSGTCHVFVYQGYIQHTRGRSYTEPTQGGAGWGLFIHCLAGDAVFIQSILKQLNVWHLTFRFHNTPMIIPCKLQHNDFIKHRLHSS